ncbi:DUF4861 domain-containing protein [Echinicola soli]|uniref:DUF4861 domain-containing protein n=1 Tax=Echinicola soli TaxID=2591634 RepID=A0A514CMQ0_9BACT|nr:DUF4861 domain-containing protein [Echinicola soli]QDH80984.1 DUF4861 domain-containing protein [Echinicola soli]
MKNTKHLRDLLIPSIKGGAFLAGAALILASCQENTHTVTIEVKNPAEVDKTAATVEVPAQILQQTIEQYGTEKLVVTDSDGKALLNQWVDLDGDNTVDQWLFQVDLEAGESGTYTVRPLKEGEEQPTSEQQTFSRFVPERTDDYTWENDRVAFRTYGPDAQRRIEQKLPDGTLSSGMDCWLKRVDYPIIDKWYKENDEKKGAYHVDTGEGYDPYHVGSSRGIGGIGIWENDSLYTSRNFVSYKRIAVGPIRTIFELTYAPWEVNGKMVSETKRISLDLGSNLNHFESTVKSEASVPNVTIGITLHNKEGQVAINDESGIYRYWEPMDKSELGLGIVMDPSDVIESKDHRVDYPDGSQLLVMAKPTKGKVSYYAGFGWKKSGQFDNAAEWDAYLKQFAKGLEKPLEVSVSGTIRTVSIKEE